MIHSSFFDHVCIYFAVLEEIKSRVLKMLGNLLSTELYPSSSSIVYVYIYACTHGIHAKYVCTHIYALYMNLYNRIVGKGRK